MAKVESCTKPGFTIPKAVTTNCRVSNEPKHKEIYWHLVSEIGAGKYRPGVRLPSESQLVKQFRVSRPTAARALRDLQTEGMIERRAGSGSFVSNQKNAAQGTRQLGLLIPGLGSTEIFEIICGELATLSRASEYTLLWGSSTHPRQDQDGSRKHAHELCEQFIERRVTGVFFAPFELTPGAEETNQHIAERFRECGIPVVLLDRDLGPFPQRSNFDLVSLDNVAAGYVLAEHLIKLGCKRIAFVARPLSAPTVNARIAGVREAFARYHLDPPANWVRVGDPNDLKFVRSLLAGKMWDAFICANDFTAAQLIRSFEQNKCRMPESVRVVGFDDAKYATLLSLPLTTIQQPCRDIATCAFRVMLSRVSEPTLPISTILVAPRLIVRESCGAYLPRAAR
jgi:LacI family transcriptional regulator